MFNKSIFLLVVFFFFIESIALADNSGKVVIAETATCAEQTLQLNGYGDRKKFFIKLYVASLYTQEKIDDESQLLSMQQALCMRLNVTSSKITSEKMIKATRDGFEKSTKGNIAPIETEVEMFLSWLEQPIKIGDVFEFAFTPHNKTQVSKNGNVLGNIENKKFSTALYGIWLGEAPAQQDLKTKLLGK
ncbi:MAG: chalcone isomerase family protein [Gammaproteobacteria bacterium]